MGFSLGLLAAKAGPEYPPNASCIRAREGGRTPCSAGVLVFFVHLFVAKARS